METYQNNSPLHNEQDKGILNSNKKKITLNADAFHGRAEHKNILQKLLEEIQTVNFRELIGLEAEEDLKQKHFVFGVVKHLLETAKKRQWNLCKAYEYIYIYNGAYWKQCNKEGIKKFFAEAAVKMGLPDYEAKHYEFTDKLLKQFLSEAHQTTLDLDSEKILINLHNGTFEFAPEGWKQRDFSADDFLTYQLPFDYDENATCPLFDKYLHRVLPDESCRKVLQEFAGYIFTNLNLEKCLVLLGGGHNGKTVFFDVLNGLLGAHNVLNYGLGLFKEPYNRAKLTNVLVNYSDEKGFDLPPDLFKNLVSGTPTQACEKYGHPFTLRNKVKFMFNCNEPPKETENTKAFYRRFEIIPFDQEITHEEKDLDLADKIIADELPGVFNWLLEGLKRILQQKEFSYCEKGDKALGEFRKQNDSVQLFVEENNYQPCNDSKEALTDLYNSYKSFCHDDGYKPVGKNKFSQRLERKGFERSRLNNGSTAFLIVKKNEPF